MVCAIKPRTLSNSAVEPERMKHDCLTAQRAENPPRPWRTGLGAEPFTLGKSSTDSHRSEARTRLPSRRVRFFDFPAKSRWKMQKSRWEKNNRQRLGLRPNRRAGGQQNSAGNARGRPARSSRWREIDRGWLIQGQIEKVGFPVRLRRWSELAPCRRPRWNISKRYRCDLFLRSMRLGGPNPRTPSNPCEPSKEN